MEKPPRIRNIAHKWNRGEQFVAYDGRFVREYVCEVCNQRMSINPTANPDDYSPSPCSIIDPTWLLRKIDESLQTPPGEQPQQPQKSADLFAMGDNFNRKQQESLAELRKRTRDAFFDGYATELGPPIVYRAPKPEVAVKSEIPVKFDDDKLRWDLLPVAGLEEVARSFHEGAKKYGVDNWRVGGGFNYRRCFAAMSRHIFAWLRGTDLDPATGTHHLAAVAFYCLIVCEYYHTKNGHDDRVKL